MAKVPREVVIERKSRTWELRQLGWTQEQIALEIGVTQPTVSRYLLALSNAAMRRLESMVEQIKIQQILQLEYIVSESLEAWRASKEPRRSVTKETLENTGPVKRKPDEKVTIRTQEQGGNAQHLRVALAALADIRQILGANAPVKFTIEKKEQPKDVPEQIVEYDPDELASIVAILASAGAIPPGLGQDIHAEADEVYTAQAYSEAGGVSMAELS